MWPESDFAEVLESGKADLVAGGKWRDEFAIPDGVLESLFLVACPGNIPNNLARNSKYRGEL